MNMNENSKKSQDLLPSSHLDLCWLLVLHIQVVLKQPNFVIISDIQKYEESK